uniref:3'-5' exonuclease domain-containing protein n=1 Tax=Angiostrongylus cantonensis TaxID=6313 RepID=A0A0K0DRT7_ANGCA
LRMPQSRIIPFFGIFLRDLYAIVNDLPNIVVIGHEGDGGKPDIFYIFYVFKIATIALFLNILHFQFTNSPNREDNSESGVGSGSLLNANKINLVAIVLDNLELFHRHSRNMTKLFEQRSDKNRQSVDTKDVKGYEPVQTIHGSCHGVHFVPLNTANFDLDVIQRLQHGTTVIHYDPESGRSVLCLIQLDYSCSTISWHKISYVGAKDPREKEVVSSKPAVVALPTNNPDSSKGNNLPSSSKVQGPFPSGFEEGELKLTSVKEVETVDSYDLDIEVQNLSL